MNIQLTFVDLMIPRDRLWVRNLILVAFWFCFIRKIRMLETRGGRVLPLNLHSCSADLGISEARLHTCGLLLPSSGKEDEWRPHRFSWSVPHC